MLNKRIRISACMMVRNEEKNLERCLKSVKSIVDEIIVVDTGSTDRTMDIARAYGAKVYEHPWENDFSLHRNQSISYASGDFILIVDADEEIIQMGPVSKFKEFLKELPEQYNAVILTVRDIQKGTVAMEFSSARIFRRGFITYEGVVHNRPVIPGNSGMFTNLLEIRHYGYDLTPEQKQAKFDRTTGLLFSRLEKDPGDYECYFYLCQIFADAGRHEEAIAYGEKYFGNIGSDEVHESIYYTLVKCSMMLKQYEKAGKWLKEGLSRIPDDIDLNFGLIEFGLATKNHSLVLDGGKNYFALYDAYVKNPTLKGKRFTYTAKPRSYTWVLGALAVTHFEVATALLKQLEDGAEGIDPEYAGRIMGTVRKCLATLEIPITIETDAQPKIERAAVNQ